MCRVGLGFRVYVGLGLREQGSSGLRMNLRKIGALGPK